MASSPSSLVISRQVDVMFIRRMAKELANEIGFDLAHQEEISLVASELASNLVKHAQRGTITLMPTASLNQCGILIISQDNGPGFKVEDGLTNGFSSTKTLGVGLGAVNRMVDELEIVSAGTAQPQTTITCKKWLPSKATIIEDCPLDIGIITRPKPGQELNGDAFIVKKHAGTTLVSIIDGLGHGATAYKAASAAKWYIDKHSEQPLQSIFQGVDRACLGTNGVVMALAHFNWIARKLTFASIGNIEAKIMGGKEDVHLSVKRGIVGRNSPMPRLTETPWHLSQCLVLHSDGLTSKWKWSDFIYLNDRPAQYIAEQMYRKLQMNHDDATLIVVK